MQTIFPVNSNSVVQNKPEQYWSSVSLLENETNCEKNNDHNMFLKEETIVCL